MSARLAVAGTYNFRPVAGFSTSDGVVREHALYRSDGLARLGETGRAQVAELGIRRIIDLRDDFEVRLLPDDLEGLPVRVSRLPLFESSGAARGVGPNTLDGLYREIVLEHAGTVAEAVREIASGDDAVLVHCTAGKDRTGIVVALSLAAVGVDVDAIVDDYAASAANLDGEWLDGMLAMIAEHGGDVTPALRALVGGSPPEAMRAVFDLLDERFGGPRDYLLGAGLQLSELSQLGELLVERH